MSGHELSRFDDVEIVDAASVTNPDTVGNPEVIDGDAFLKDHQLEKFGDRMVSDHEGNPMALRTAVVECGAARKAILGAVEMARDMGGDEAVEPMMDKYFTRLSEKAVDPEVKKRDQQLAEKTQESESSKDNLDITVESPTQTSRDVKILEKPKTQHVSEATYIAPAIAPALVEVKPVRITAVIRPIVDHMYQDDARWQEHLRASHESKQSSTASETKEANDEANQVIFANSMQKAPDIDTIADTKQYEPIASAVSTQELPSTKADTAIEVAPDHEFKVSIPLGHNNIGYRNFTSELTNQVVPDELKRIIGTDTEVLDNALEDDEMPPLVSEVDPFEDELAKFREQLDNWSVEDILALNTAAHDGVENAPTLVYETQVENSQEQTVTAPETPVDNIVHAIESALVLDETQIEKTETFVATMPIPVQEKLADILAIRNNPQAEPEAIEQAAHVEQLTVRIAEVADRLHVLYAEDRLTDEEAVIIERVLVSQYAELLSVIGVEPDEEQIKNFIKLIKSDAYTFQSVQAAKADYQIKWEKDHWAVTLTDQDEDQGILIRWINAGKKVVKNNVLLSA